MSCVATFISDYWGKARASETSACAWHPLAYHGLDVAAAGEAILAARPRLLQTIAQGAGFPEATCKGWLLLLLALHDLGKFADCFQGVVPDRWAAENREAWEAKGFGPKPIPHGVAGATIWNDVAGDVVAATVRWDCDTREAFETWLYSVFGHHGKPISDMDGLRWNDIATGKAARDAREYAAAVANLLLSPEHIFADELLKPSRFQTASWLVSGFSVIADWIGSNQQWFPYAHPDRCLNDYWEEKRNRAREAVCNAGLVHLRPAHSYGLQEALNVTSAPTRG